ncbi:MAG: hypothetical protein J1F09_06235 [Oscillospiraceae bacterium]|nr:hypothetical protein [Oscillospiraceae bacterium]
MNNEQFFKAIDGVDDELLKDALDPEFDYVQYPKVYRLEKRRFNWKAAAACAACLAAVVGAGFALKSGLSALPVQSEPSDMSGAADSSVLDGENSGAVSTKIPEGYYVRGCALGIQATFDSPDNIGFGVVQQLEITEPQTVTAYLHTGFDLDLLTQSDNIPYRVFVFADGKPIEFATAGTDDYALWHDYVLDDVVRRAYYDEEDGTVWKGEIQGYTSIDFKADETMRNITFVGTAYPGYFQPHSWSGFPLPATSLAVNNSCVSDKAPESKNIGEFFDKADIGKGKYSWFCDLYLGSDGNDARYDHRDLEYSELNNDIYLECLYKDYSYYLMLLIDDEPVPIFDGEYAYFVEGGDPSRVFRYKIPAEYLPTEGQHTIQGVAISCYPNIDYTAHDFSTQRIRMVAVEANGNNSVAIGLLHGFEIDHFQHSFSDRESEFFTRVPDGMLPEYDFTKVGEMVGNGWRDSCDGIEFYSFPDNKDFILALIDGEYVPFVDAKVCGKYGITSAAELSYITYPGSASGFVHFTDLVKFGDRAELELSSDIYSALMYANTVEELKQGLSECMHSERISEVVFYKNKEDYANGIKIENPSGVFRVGMCIRVYYDGHNSYLDRIVRNNRIDGRFYPEANEPVRDNCYPEDGRLD